MVFAFLTPFLQSRRNRWGASDDEVKRAMSGDELIPQSQWMWTHAITINAPVERVWPWLIQMGQGRGGFYSYESLENLVGCDIRNADSIVPELQSLKVGDGILLHPKAPPLSVALIEPLRAILLHARDYSPAEKSDESTKAKAKNHFSSSWGFYTERIDDRTTRLIIRWKVDYDPTFKNRLSYGPFVTGPIGFVMDRKMLLGIRKRSEGITKWN